MNALVRVLGWGLCGGLLVMASCVTHRGDWRLESPPPHEGVEVVLLAGVAPSDRGARAVAERVEQTLKPDRPRMVVWLGSVAAERRAVATPRAQRRGPRCSDPARAWDRPAAAALAETARREAGETSYAVTGVLDHRCGHEPALRQDDAAGPHPWRMPGVHTWLRVFADGSVATLARCRSGACAFDTAPAREEQARADLVMIDLGPWLYPADDPVLRARDDADVASLVSLLLAVTETPPHAAPPRLLVSSAPIEAGAEHGLGALRADATFHALPPELRDALLTGHFAGVLAAYDRSLYATADLGNAIKRADRAWLPAPVFQVAAGAVAEPNARSSMVLRRRRVRESQAYQAPLWSDHAGFAVLHLGSESAQITLHARRGRHWETGSLMVPLRPLPYPPATPSPNMAPCRDCPPIPAGER